MAVASSSRSRPENAFDEIMNPLTSPATTLKKGPFDVFINHRGPDVKRKLASSIYHILGRLRVKVFLDQNELDLGDIIPKEIEDVMRTALIHIGIFSKNYARSPWCLAELSLMLETRTKIIPVFYDVQPSDLRWVDSQEMYAQAFEEHVVKCRYTSETLEKWKKALQEVSYYKGFIFRSNADDEGILLNRIVDSVLQEIKNVKVPFEVAQHPVGLDDVLRDFDASTSVPADQNAQIVGIVGMSGSGKTTLAKQLYNREYKAFDNCSFLFDVREAALPELQKKLLEDLLHLKDVPFNHESQGKLILAGRFKSSRPRVLIVLDDVDDINQLNALLPEEGRNLGPGSLIIITTCSRDVLNWEGISSVHRMTTLNTRHAEELFCRHAFLQSSPPYAFKSLVQEFITACGGLPLSIKVIAEMLYRKPEEEWKSNLQRISRSVPEKIKERLKLSYDALDPEAQAIFLDIACFFVGEKKTLATAVWDAAEWSGLENLVNKCLVEIDKQDRIRMHNHLRDLGRGIAMECPQHRVCYPQQISKIMRYRGEITSIRGIMAATTQFVVCRGHDEFPKCCNPYVLSFEECIDLGSLELLVVTGEYFTLSSFARLSKHLVWLRLFDFQDTDLPPWLSVTNLRVLELYGASGLQLWENSAHPPEKLREIIITAAKGNIFNSFPTKISDLKHLTKIALISEYGAEFRFKTLPDELCNLRSLRYLELRHCKLLSSLPNSFGELKRLQHLDLCSCEMLWKLPESFKQLVDLEYLDLSGCRKLVPMPDILEMIRTLKHLNFSDCSTRWRELPRHIKDQHSLTELFLENTMLRNVPSNISQLSELKTLRIGSPHLRDLPTSLGDLPSLTNLQIKGCEKLEILPQSIDRLKLLESLRLEDTGVKSLPEGFTRLTNLQTLEIFDCPIAKLDFSSASSSSMKKLKVIHLKGTKVTRVSISKDGCPSLETLQLEQNRHLTEMDIFSESVKMVKVYECTMLDSIKDIPSLVNLKTLEITGCHELDEDTVAAVREWDSVHSHMEDQVSSASIEGHNTFVSFEGGYDSEQEVKLEVVLE